MERRTLLKAGLSSAAILVSNSTFSQVIPPKPENSLLEGESLFSSKINRSLFEGTAGNPFQDMPRSSFGSIQVGTKLYFVGGHIGIYHTYANGYFTGEFLEYDLINKTWLRLSSYPFPVQGLRLAADGNFLYAFGGFRYERGHDYQKWNLGETKWAAASDDSVYRFDLIRGTWSFVCQMPRRRSSNLLLKAGRRVFLLAGWDGTPSRRGDRSGVWHSAVDVFDLDEQGFIHWEKPLPSPVRRALTSAEYNGSLIMIGGLGRSSGGPPPHYDLVTKFDPQTGEYSDDLFPKLPAKLFSPGACWTGKWLVVAGGMDDQYKLFNTLHFCKPGSSVWTEASMKLPKGAMFPELYPTSENSVLVLGGHGDGLDEKDKLPLGMFLELEIA